MSAVSLANGSVFAERYQIVRCLATGGMGAVYEVTHIETNRRRALKVMHPHLVQSDELRERFRLEARVAADIESEFIVDVFDAGIDVPTQMPFLVMELLRGEEVGRLLRRKGRFSPTEVVTYLHQAALALDKTHRAMIVHRDLKPANLFLTEREDGAPRIKVLDFGIAKVIADAGNNVDATRSIGTPPYMAPEQFRPGHKVSPATDLYALGMMAYTLLVGKAYWAEEAGGNANVFAFANVVMNGPQERGTERALRAGVTLPPAFDHWFAQATALQPEQRFHSATALVESLAGALGVVAPGANVSGARNAAPAPSNRDGFGDPAPASQYLREVGAPMQVVTPAEVPGALPQAAGGPVRSERSGTHWIDPGNGDPSPARGGTAAMGAAPAGLLNAVPQSGAATAFLSTADAVSINSRSSTPAPAPARSRKGFAASIFVALAGLALLGIVAFVARSNRGPTATATTSVAAALATPSPAAAPPPAVTATASPISTDAPASPSATASVAVATTSAPTPAAEPSPAMPAASAKATAAKAPAQTAPAKVAPAAETPAKAAPDEPPKSLHIRD